MKKEQKHDLPKYLYLDWTHGVPYGYNFSGIKGIRKALFRLRAGPEAAHYPHALEICQQRVGRWAAYILLEYSFDAEFKAHPFVRAWAFASAALEARGEPVAKAFRPRHSRLAQVAPEALEEGREEYAKFATEFQPS